MFVFKSRYVFVRMVLFFKYKYFVIWCIIIKCWDYCFRVDFMYYFVGFIFGVGFYIVILMICISVSVLVWIVFINII